MTRNELATMPEKELNELVANCPVEKRGMLAAVFPAVIKHAKQALKNEAKAKTIAAAAIVNWWYIGKKAGPQIQSPGNPQLQHKVQLGWDDFGVHRNDGAKSKRLATRFKTEESLRAALDECDGYPTLNSMSRNGTVAASSSTGEVEWYTPQEYTDMARKVMGSIDVDPASCLTANKHIQAKTYYTKRDNGLEQEWRGNIWMNPPYEAKTVGLFTEKLQHELAIGNCKQAIVLLNNATDTVWFGDIVRVASVVCFKTGRIAFIDPSGNAIAGAAQGQVFLYFGRRLAKFSQVFSSIGWIARIEQ